MHAMQCTSRVWSKFEFAHLGSNVGDDVVQQGGLQDCGVEELLLGVAQALLQLHKRVVGGSKDSRHQVGVVENICMMHMPDQHIASREGRYQQLLQRPCPGYL